MVAWPLKPREEHLQHHLATSIKLWLFEVKYERALFCVTVTVSVGFFLPVVSKMVCVTSNSGKPFHKRVALLFRLVLYWKRLVLASLGKSAIIIAGRGARLPIS